MLVKCWWVLGWNTITQSKMWTGQHQAQRKECSGAGGDKRQPKQRTTKGSSVWSPKENQPLPTLTQTPASQKRPGHLPPGNTVAVGWSQERQGAVHTRNWSIHATGPATASPLFPPACPLLPHSPPSRCFPEQVAEADTREHHSAPVRSTVNSHHRLSQGYIMKKWSRRQKERSEAKFILNKTQT